MKEVLIVAIWDTNDDVYTRSLVINKNSKKVFVNGKRPNRVIVPDSLTDRRILRVISRIGSKGCQIVKAVGK